MIRKLLLGVGLLFASVGCLAGAAFGAEPVVPSPDDPGAFVNLIVSAATSKNWPLLAALVVIVLVWAARKWGGDLAPWLKTDRGGAILAILLGVAVGLAGPLIAGVPWSWSLLVSAASGALAAGLRQTGARIVAPKDGSPAAAP